MLTKESILEHENRVAEVLSSGDVFNLEAMLHDDMLMVNSKGHTLTKAMDIDEVRSGVLRISVYKASDHVINIIGDIAVVSLSVHVEATMAGNVMSLELKMLRVWKEFEDGVKIVAVSGMRKDEADI
ncbi:MAG: nuclear transport factor 2 family protein [Chryseolinea sp.]